MLQQVSRTSVQKRCIMCLGGTHAGALHDASVPMLMLLLLAANADADHASQIYKCM